MKPIDVVKTILKTIKLNKLAVQKSGTSYAPVNIALCKYWGKRNDELHLPAMSSLSITLPSKGTRTTISLIEGTNDKIKFNNENVDLSMPFARRLICFLDLFRWIIGEVGIKNKSFFVKTSTNIPIDAGLASSASGFASIVMAIDKLFGLDLSKIDLSILARLGSGSACRSVWNGFVKWNKGSSDDGLDSYAELLPYAWPDLRVGLLVLSSASKAVGSTNAMDRTIKTSCYYNSWCEKTENDVVLMENAIKKMEFDKFGEIAELNSLAMHACAMSSNPPIMYAIPDTVKMIKMIWNERGNGLPIYFTQDAGPNLKLLFLANYIENVKQLFPTVEIINPYENIEEDQLHISDDNV